MDSPFSFRTRNGPASPRGSGDFAAHSDTEKPAFFTMTKWFKKLDNPFLLAAEGFLAGAVLLWATTPSEVEAQPNRPSAQIEASVPAASQL